MANKTPKKSTSQKTEPAPNIQKNPKKEPSANTPDFSLSRFEAACYAREHEPAALEFMALLHMLEKNYGALSQGFLAKPTADLLGKDQDPHIINRICAALSALFSDPTFNLSEQGFRKMLHLHRWTATLFATSSFKNADHILRALSVSGSDDSKFEVQLKHMYKFCLLFTPNSVLPISLDSLWSYNKNLTAALACALVSPRLLGSITAHQKRETILKWLPEKLDEIDDLNVLPVAVLHDVYMHCSYADLAEKHLIKASINRLVRKNLIQRGITDIEFKKKTPQKGEKPVMLVLLEWFSGSHSIYRTHSKSITAARSQFKIIGVGQKDTVDDLGRAIFDQYIELEESNKDMVSFVRRVASEIQPDLLYYPAFGMFPHSIFLSNLRLAPVQVVSYGHPATSQSPFIDYFVLPEDWVGDPKCFSEKLLPLPAEAMPFVPSASTIDIKPKINENPTQVKIAVAATTMKLNPTLLSVLQHIKKEAPKVAGKPVVFHFFIGFARGLVSLEVKSFIYSYIPDAVIFSHLPYDKYISYINECDMYLNPFPFGNTNGIVDMASIGLVGVNKTGPEVLEHIDEAMFRRMGLPEWTIAKTHDEYIQGAFRLIADDKLRVELRKKLIEENAVDVFYKGDGKGFGEALLKLIQKEPSKSPKEKA